MDFMHDQLGDGQRFRTFNVLDVFSRQCLAVVAQPSFRSKDVTTVLDRLIEEHGAPHRITCDNGTEFTANHFDAWAYHRGVFTDFIAPGKPVQNGFMESSPRGTPPRTSTACCTFR
jgi:putative transposase